MVLHLDVITLLSFSSRALLIGVGDLDPNRHRRLATEDTHSSVIPTLSSDEDEDDCGRFASEDDAGRDETERGVILMATATGAMTASPPVTAP